MPLAFTTLKDGSDRYVFPLSNFMNVAHTGFNSNMEVKRR